MKELIKYCLTDPFFWAFLSALAYIQHKRAGDKLKELLK